MQMIVNNNNNNLKSVYVLHRYTGNKISFRKCFDMNWRFSFRKLSKYFTFMTEGKVIPVCSFKN